MPSLRELQSGFAASVFGGGEGLLAWCAGANAKRGLEGYRNSVLANLAGAVRASYPVLGRIVGQVFLNAAIKRYVLERPSTSGDLNNYGGDFCEFLATFAPAAGLPYLPDVARLEWRVQAVQGEQDAPPQDLSRLAAARPEDWPGLHFRLDPAHAVLRSDWPLARIWAVNQPGYAGSFQVDFDAAQTVLIQRRPTGTSVEAIHPGDAVLIEALSSGHTFGTAVELATRSDGFDLQAALQRFIANGLLNQAY